MNLKEDMRDYLPGYEISKHAQKWQEEIDHIVITRIITGWNKIYLMINDHLSFSCCLGKGNQLPDKSPDVGP